MKVLVATVVSVVLITSAWAQATQPAAERASTPMPAREDVRRVAPALEKYVQRRLLGDVWKRPGLSPRDRSIVTIAALIARNQATELPYYLEPQRSSSCRVLEAPDFRPHV